jgi:peptidyl-prolyl cis-trans isomerase D
MLSFFRNLAGTWPARIFFMALAAAFVGWGVANRGVLSSMGGAGNEVADVDGTPISPQVFTVAYKQAIENVSKRYGDPSKFPPELRRQVVEQTMQRLVAQEALNGHAKELGVATPDTAVASAISEMPAFQGISGKFERNAYLLALNNAGMTPDNFQEEVRKESTRNQILDALTAGAYASDALTNLIYTYAAEERRADIVTLPFSGRALPAAPADNVLQRYYANNIARYTAPEYRHVKLVVLSPATVGRTLTLTDADMHAWFNLHKSEWDFPETRDLEVITTASKDVAAQLAAKWRAGAPWAAMQEAAKAAKATAISLPKTDKAGVPTPELADAAFGAHPDTITGPISEALGFQLVHVFNVVPAKHASFDSLHDTIRDRLGAERAIELIDPRAQKLQDLFAGGSHIDEIPADLGAAGAEGTLDANGNALDGTPAPIPVAENVRKLLVADVFKASKNDAPQLTEGPDHVWYALAVQDIIKPAAKPFATVQAKVLADWQQDQIHHTQEQAAAKILAAVNGGQTLTNAAWGSGLAVTRTPPLQRRGAAPNGIPEAMVNALFGLKIGQATMAQGPDGFIVASLAEITVPDAKLHAPEMAELKTGLTKSIANDVISSYANGVQSGATVHVNDKMVQQFIQAPGE